ncbi:MAG: hypothetical protein HOV80_01590 [Polyangiaceae bacterium]|nr:hypothetical protein [Polyangiaceae bacterium]
MRELIAMVRGLLAERRTGERLICRYLADLSDRIQEQRSAPPGFDSYGSEFADIYQAAQALFGMSIRQARERVRVGRALRTLPHIEAALVEGKLAYSRVREIARVATPDTELEWLQLAKDVPVAILERRVADAAGTQAEPSGPRAAGPRSIQWKAPSTLELRITLRPDQWSPIHRALEAVKRASVAPLDDAEALARIAEDALGRLAADAQPESSAPNGTTQTGSLVGPIDNLNEHDCSRVLTTMGNAREWNVDSLVEASGLRVEEVARAVTLLEIQGRVRHDFGTYQVV